jgi:[acyl-carrier-protein] S-malonyltransferase
MVAGHSLGEFSALVANGSLSFEDGLQLVSIRANAMHKACLLQPSTMAAILGLADEKAEEVCDAVQKETGEIVVPANYNCPGQLVISGTVKGIEIACERMKAAGAKRALVLPVGGAFHSPLMEPAKEELKGAIEKTTFHQPTSHVYQNIAARAVFDREEIKQNLIDQLTGAVRWTQSVQAMIKDGATKFTEVGPGKVLQGLVLKIDKAMQVDGCD